MSKSKIRIKKIEVEATPGSTSSDGIKECIFLSFEKNTIVEYYHSNSKYVINGDSILKSIYKSENTPGIIIQ